MNPPIPLPIAPFALARMSAPTPCHGCAADASAFAPTGLPLCLDHLARLGAKPAALIVPTLDDGSPIAGRIAPRVTRYGRSLSPHRYPITSHVLPDPIGPHLVTLELVALLEPERIEHLVLDVLYARDDGHAHEDRPPAPPARDDLFAFLTPYSLLTTGKGRMLPGDQWGGWIRRHAVTAMKHPRTRIESPRNFWK